MNMKKIFLCIAVLAILISCKKTSYVAKFDKLPQERAAEQIKLVSSTLTGATNGWIATLPTQAGGGYGFYMSFDNSSNVMMYGDMTGTSSSTSGASYYRVKQDLGTELVFDTYNYISMLDDPNTSVLGGASKVGYSSDIEFTFDKIVGDSMIFIGKKYRQPFKMVKATAAQKASYVAGEYKTAIDKFNAFFSTTKNPYIEIVSGSTTLKAGISFNTSNVLASGKRVDFTGLAADGKTVVSSNAKFAYTIDGVTVLNTGITYQNISFVRFAWKDATTLAVYDSTGKEYIIKSAPTPLLPAYLLLGAKFTTVTLPNGTTYPGWSPDFVTRRAAANSATLATPYNLRLDQMAFIFDAVNKKLILRCDIYQGTTRFVGDLPYTYTLSTTGVFKFTAGVATGNGALIAVAMGPITTQRLNADTFTLGYFTNPNNGATLVSFTSVENPDFSFTGTFN